MLKFLTKAGHLYMRLAEKVKMTYIAFLTGTVFLISLIPEFALTFVARATGDDYGYGRLARIAWLNTHSLAEVLRAAQASTMVNYYSWQGTWFSIFLFSLQPEVFHEKAYWVVIPMTICLWIGVTTFVLYFFLVKMAGMSKSSFIAADALFLFLNIQYIPGTQTGLFWYNGIIHYTLPYFMCLLTAYNLAQYLRTYRLRHLTGLLLLLSGLGGSNYQAALFAFLACGIFMLISFFFYKSKKALLLLLPLTAEAIGLYISMKSPGNHIRGGDDFGFDALRAVKTIVKCFLYGIRDIGNYMIEKPGAMAGLLFLGALVIYAVRTGAGGESPRMADAQSAAPSYARPLIFIGAAGLIYFALQAPAIYAQVEVSKGVPNTNFQAFLGAFLAVSVYVGGWLARVRAARPPLITIPRVLIPLGVAGVIIAGIFHPLLNDTTAGKSYLYLSSGKAQEFKAQMDLQTAILLGEPDRSIVLPYIDAAQSPLMNMSATEDPDEWRSKVLAEFYGKTRVTAIDREKWYQTYGEYYREKYGEYFEDR